MKKITSMIAAFLLLAGMTANAQIAVPTLTTGKLLTADELNASKGTKRIAIQLVHQAPSDMNDWYYPQGGTGTSHYTKDYAYFENVASHDQVKLIDETVVYEWIEVGENKHYLKKVSEGKFISSDQTISTLVDIDKAQDLVMVHPDPNLADNTPNTEPVMQTSWGNCPPTTITVNGQTIENPSLKFICRIAKSDKSAWINSNDTKWDTRKGVWTMFYVYDLTGHVQFGNIVGNEITGLEEGAKIATFCSPFATTVPAGVKAYNVKEAAANTNSVTLEEVTNAIPANQGVILVSKNANAILPAATGNVENFASLLKGTASATASMGANDYVLATVNDNNGLNATQFYKASLNSVLKLNKAYLQLPNNLSGSIKMNFGGETTAIEKVATESDENAPIFDLSGRRVNNMVKGGIYIQNGKKFIK